MQEDNTFNPSGLAELQKVPAGPELLKRGGERTMHTVILACSSLTDYVRDAQEKQKTSYPVLIADRKYHAEPEKMKKVLAEMLARLPEETDTVLVAMGFCGGSWDSVQVDRKVVIPRADDCISLLLHTDDVYCPNRKETGHLYMMEKDPGDFSLEKMFGNISIDYPGWDRDSLFHMWFDNYRYLDIIDTGLYDCYTEEYAEEAQKNADLFHGTLDYVRGSNRLLEKLVSGRWDEQFLVAQPGQVIRHRDFFG